MRKPYRLYVIEKLHSHALTDTPRSVSLPLFARTFDRRRAVVIQRRVIAAATSSRRLGVILSHVLVNVRQDRNLRAFRHCGATAAIINEGPRPSRRHTGDDVSPPWGCFRFHPVSSHSTPKGEPDESIIAPPPATYSNYDPRCPERSWPANWLSCDHVSRDFVIRISSGIRCTRRCFNSGETPTPSLCGTRSIATGEESRGPNRIIHGKGKASFKSSFHLSFRKYFSHLQKMSRIIVEI